MLEWINMKKRWPWITRVMEWVVELISGLVAIVKFISFLTQGCFNNRLDESPVAWRPATVNMQAVLPWEQDDWWEEWDTKQSSTKQWSADIWGQHHGSLLEIRQVRNFFCTWTQTLKETYSESTLFYNVSAVLMACVRFGLCMCVSICMCMQASYLPYFIPTCFHCLGHGWPVLHWSGFKCCCERNVRGEGSWG